MSTDGAPEPEFVAVADGDAVVLCACGLVNCVIVGQPFQCACGWAVHLTEFAGEVAFEARERSHE